MFVNTVTALPPGMPVCIETVGIPALAALLTSGTVGVAAIGYKTIRSGLRLIAVCSCWSCPGTSVTLLGAWTCIVLTFPLALSLACRVFRLLTTNGLFNGTHTIWMLKPDLRLGFQFAHVDFASG